MAKAKSKKITLEEALVPVEEQPYEVPENWCWIKLGTISSIISKGTTPKGGKTAYVDEGIDFLRVENINDDGTICHDDMMHVTEETHTGFLKRSILEENDILVSIAGTLGKTAIVKNDDLPLNTNQAVAFVRLRDNGEISREYIRYAIDTPVIQNILMSKTKVTAIPNLTLEIISECLIPLPPLSEQQRIVEQIESLFTKLDEAKEKALSVVESFESRKKAILNNAFNGLYSTDWREKHHCTLDDWKDRKINEICIPRAGFAFNSKKFTESGIQIIRMGNLYAGKLNLSRSPVFYDISDVDDNIIKRSMVHDGDILLTLTGTKYKRDYGYAVCIEGEHELLVNQRILCLSPTEKIDKEYLLYYLRSEIFRDIFFSNETGGVNQGNVSSKFVENIEIKLPSIEEQKEISKILKNILTKEEQAKELAEFVIEQIELMKKSILAKAFRGELGTNIATEESAIELLKSIL